MRPSGCRNATAIASRPRMRTPSIRACPPYVNRILGRVPSAREVATLGLLGPDLALETLLEPLDLAGGVDDRLLARIEGMAVAADVDPQLGARRTDRPLGPAGPAVHLGFVVLGMDVWLHAGSAAVAASCAAVAACSAITRTRFFAFAANSNLTRPAVVANTV